MAFIHGNSKTFAKGKAKGKPKFAPPPAAPPQAMNASRMFGRGAPPAAEPDADEAGGPSDNDQDDRQPMRAKAMFGRKGR
jgi:hypothetical protein